MIRHRKIDIVKDREILLEFIIFIIDGVVTS